MFDGGLVGEPDSFSYAWLRNGVPIAGQTGSTYTVQGADAGSALSCSVTARNDGGEYTLRGLPSGTYEVAFQADGSDYLSQAFSEKPVSGKGDPVTVRAGASTGGVNARLQRGGRISGKVTAAATGVPLKEIEACVYGAVLHFSTCAYTGSSGEYTVSGLPADSYTVSFETFEAGYNYAPQYYSGKAKSIEATPVQVGGGASVSGINAALTEGGQIKGTVSAGGGPLEGAEVCASDQCATTDSNGRYTISNLASGKYTVSFSPIPAQDELAGLFGSESEEPKPPRQSPYLPQYYNDKAAYFEAEEVQVQAGSEETGIDATLETGGYIEGTVVAKEGGSPIGKVLVCAQNEEEPSRCTITAANGDYRIEGLAESSYEVEFITEYAAFYNHSNYASQVYKDREISEKPDPVAVKKNVGTGGINGELLEGAQISGKVVAAGSGTPLAKAEACAIGVPTSFLFFNCTETNGAGEYTITGLSTGSYEVFFLGPENTEYLYEIYNNEPNLTSADKIAVTIEHRYTGINGALQLGGRITGRVTAADTGAPIPGVRVCADPTTETEFVSGNSSTPSPRARQEPPPAQLSPCPQRPLSPSPRSSRWLLGRA